MKITRKELDKNIKIALKSQVKKYRYKTRGNVLFKKSDDYFISILFAATGVNNNLINVRGTVKPYFFDDIFWTVFQMQENLNQPMGLRADGAFAVRGLQIFNQYKEIEDYNGVEEYVGKLLDMCDVEIMNVINEVGNNFRKFINCSKEVEDPGLYDYVLGEMLVYIKEENYLKARNLAVNELENHRYGDFKNQGKYIYEHVVDFCESKC